MSIAEKGGSMEQNKRTQAARKTPPKKKKRSKKSIWRRRMRIAVVCIPFVAVILLVGLFIGSVTLKIENYSVEGIKKYTAEQIWAASGLEKGKSLLLSNLGEAEDNILVKLPYISKVTIKRKLPDTIAITVTQSKAELALQVGEEWVLVNSSGKVMEKLGKNEPPKEIMRLQLPTAKKCELGYEIEFDLKEDELSPIEVCENLLAQVEKSALKGKITMVDITDPEDVTMVYDGRIRLHIGMPTELSAKLNLAAGAVDHEDAIDPEQTGEMNLTVIQEAYFRPDSIEEEKGDKKEPQSEAATEQTTQKQN